MGVLNDKKEVPKPVDPKTAFYQLHYPRYIYKDGEDPKVVMNPFEHSDYFEKGWSGPPLFFKGDVEGIDEKVERLKVELTQALKLQVQIRGDKVKPPPAVKTVQEPEPEGKEEGKKEESPTSEGKEEGKNFRCPDCHKLFGSKEELVAHMKTHSKK